MKDHISLKGLEFSVIVGVLPQEREKKQRILIDLDMELGRFKASESDSLSDTVHYGEAVAVIEELLACEQPFLIERLAGQIVERLFDWDARLLSCQLRLHKPEAPISASFQDVMVVVRRRRDETVELSLGSNLGDREAEIRGAAKAVASLEGVGHFRLSSIYETLPWGLEEQPPFLNAAAIFRYRGDPFRLLAEIQKIENAAGRTRERHWGPRTLDLDIISFGDLRLNTEELQLPHPFADQREFVKIPLRELKTGKIEERPALRFYAPADWSQTPADLVIVDAQYDFVEGSLACKNAEKAIAKLVQYINARPSLRVFYTADSHSGSNRSFAINGGTWPLHCVANSRGARISDLFYMEIANEKQRPGSGSIFYKGKDDLVEEYSAFESVREDGTKLKSGLSRRVVLAGIASEFCVRETALDLCEAGYSVELLADALAWVDDAAHLENLEYLRARGVKLISTGQEDPERQCDV